MDPIDTTNDFLVGLVGIFGADALGVVINLPPLVPMPRDKALRLAAYIVALADPTGEEFPAVLAAVQNA